MKHAVSWQEWTEWILNYLNLITEGEGGAEFTLKSWNFIPYRDEHLYV